MCPALPAVEMNPFSPLGRMVDMRPVRHSVLERALPFCSTEGRWTLGTVGIVTDSKAPSVEQAALSPVDSMTPSAATSPPPAEMSGLIVRIAEHADRVAFTQLFQFFAPRVKAFLLRRGATMTAADELVQDILLTVWRKAGSFDPRKAAASTWIFTIARNRFIDRVRGEARPEPDAADPNWVPAAAADPDEHMRQLEGREKLGAAWAALSEEQATVLHHMYFRGLSLSAIAEASSLPLGTVKTRARLGMARLRHSMAKDPPSATTPAGSPGPSIGEGPGE